MTEGRIDSAAISKPGFSFFRRVPYRAQLCYSYLCAGERHTGVYCRDLYTEPEGETFIRGLEGQAVTIHYNPAKPSRSALLESDIEAMAENRPLALTRDFSGESELSSNRSQPFLAFFTVLSCIGLILSLWVHIGALMGRRVAPESFFWGLHVGIFVVWFPAIFAAQKRAGSINRRDFWRVVLKGSPEWMRYMVYAFLGYAVLNFSLFMSQAPTGKTGANPPASVWRGFSGHWMAFYSAAFAILFSSMQVRRNRRRLPDGSES